MSKMKKRVIVTLLLMLIIYIGSIIISRVPISMDRQMDGIEIDLLSKEEMIPRTIKVKGKYYINLFGKDHFDGNIVISGYPITEYETESFEIEKNFKRIYLSYSAFPINAGYYSIHRREIGMLYTSTLLKQIVIVPYESIISNREDTNFDSMSDQGQFRYIIVSGTTNRDEAIEILQNTIGDELKKYGANLPQ